LESRKLLGCAQLLGSQLSLNAAPCAFSVSSHDPMPTQQNAIKGAMIKFGVLS